MLEVTLETQQSEAGTNNILSQKYKPELAHYLPSSLFILTTSSLLKAIKQVFLMIWPGLMEKLSRGILKNQGTQQWDTRTLEYKVYNQLNINLLIYTCKTRAKQMYCFVQLCTLVQKRRKILLRYMQNFPHHIKQGKQIHLRHVCVLL